MLRRVLDGAMTNLGAELARTLKSMLTPQAMLTVAGSCVVLAALHAVGVGEVVDAGLTFYAWWTAGTAGLAALADLLVAIVDTIDARNSKDLDDAARLFTGAVAVLGVSILTLVMTRGGRRSPAGKEISETVSEDASAETAARRGIARDTSREDAKQAAAQKAFQQEEAVIKPQDQPVDLAKDGSGVAGESPQINPAEVAGKTPQQVDEYARSKGLIPKGPDPMAGRGAYVDPVTGEQRILCHPDGAPDGHLHVNDPSGQRLDQSGEPVAPESPDAHLPLGDEDGE